jgi:dihydroxyacetone kinase
LKEVTRIAQLVADNTVSIGSSLSHVHVPGRREPEDDGLKEGEVEIGMGIHNEAGSERKQTDLPGLVKTMLSHSLNTADQDRSFSKITEKDEVVLLVERVQDQTCADISRYFHDKSEWSRLQCQSSESGGYRIRWSFYARVTRCPC